ncbi:MAG: DUF87 domain-containing protein [Pseudomonadota bacterium]
MSQHELPATAAQAPNAPEARSVGHVIECDGSEAQIHALSGRDGQTRDYWAVGQLISIEVGDKRLVGLLHRVQTGPQGWVDGEANHMTLSVELAGEVRPSDTGGHYFSSGISAYPFLGAKAHRIQKEDLVTIYKSGDQVAIPVGVLSQARDIPAIVSVDALLSRHFAVVGTTGTGKSTAVSMILHMIAEKKQDQRILILDPHNEYSSAFGEKAHTITADSLDMPFWLLNLEEFAQVVFRGRESTDEEVDILREFIPKAKMLYRDGAVGKVLRKGGGGDGNAITADSPLPYRIADLIALLDEEIGSLDGAIRRLAVRQLKSRIEAAMNDPRFAFMFGSHDASDRIDGVLGQIFRVPMNGKPISVFQLSGIPSEVVDSIVSVICRLAFELALASDSQVKTLVVCEEAHRYIPTDPDTAFAPTRAAISRIAKEGRKYGVSLAVVTQRPHELDPTILSQCNTIFAMRLGNDADQDVMRKAIASGSRSSIAFLSSLADRECIAFGRAVSTPMRMMFRSVNVAARPSSQNVKEEHEVVRQTASMPEIVMRLRGEVATPQELETTLSEDEWILANSTSVAKNIEDPIDQLRNRLAGNRRRG